MVWNVDLDEFSGGTLCPSMHDVAYPLLTALNDALTSPHSLPTTSSTVPQSVFAPRLLRVIITRIYELPWIKGLLSYYYIGCHKKPDLLLLLKRMPNISPGIVATRLRCGGVFTTLLPIYCSRFESQSPSDEVRAYGQNYSDTLQLLLARYFAPICIVNNLKSHRHVTSPSSFGL